jgi:hypothetical protein
MCQVSPCDQAQIEHDSDAPLEMKLVAACAVIAALAAESQAFVPTGPSLRPASFGGPAPMIASRVRTASSLLVSSLPAEQTPIKLLAVDLLCLFDVQSRTPAAAGC